MTRNLQSFVRVSSDRIGTRAGTDTSVGRECLSSPRANALHRPGSALILVLVSLVMMVLIGTAYVQVARVDRRATAQLTGVNNLDTVRDAVIAYMAKVLKDDVFDDAGLMFNPASYDEAYDHAWTNRGVFFTATSKLPATMGNNIGNAAGGQNDDTWLASTYQSAEVAAYYPHATWNHLSNLNGTYLRLPKSGSGATLPTEMVVEQNQTFANYLRHDGYGEVYVDVSSQGDNFNTAIYSAPMSAAAGTWTIDYNADPTWQPYGVDSDADGILDAAWTWAPDEVRQIGALTYVVAYRIIDLSSLANVNVATALTSNGSTLPTTTAEATRGAFPSDLDLSRLLAKSNKGGSWAAEFGTVMTTRGLATTFPTLAGNASWDLTSGVASYGGTGTRAVAWTDPAVGAKFYGYSNNRFDMESELELRSRGGLNTATIAPIENAMPLLLRRAADPTVEATYVNVAGLDNPGNDLASNSFMNGCVRGLNGGYALDNSARTYPEVRHFLTTFSGSSILASQYPGWTAGSASLDRLQYDLVYRGTSDSSVSLTPTQRAAEIRDRLEKILKIGTPMYLGLTDTAVIRQIATEYAVNIVDYADPDNTPTVLSDGVKEYYGMEALPFFREVYVEAQYEAKDVAPDPDPMTYEEWQIIPQTLGIAIEIGNPFDKELKFQSGVTTGNGAKVKIRIMQGTPAAPIQVAEQVIPAGMVIPAREVGVQHKHIAIFHSGGSAGVATANGGGGAAISQANSLALAASGIDGARIYEMGPDIIAGLTLGTDMYFELVVTCSDGKEVCYDRFWPNTGQEFRIKDKETGTGALLAPKKEYMQIGMRRDGRTNRYLSNRGRQVATPVTPQEAAYKNGTQFAKFSNEDKSVNGDASFDKFQMAHANHQLMSVAELGYIFMVGFYADATSAEGDFVTRLSARDGSKGPASTGGNADVASPARHYLSFTADGSTAGAVVVPTATKLPHFSMVMDQFTTISPRWDKVDNDNDDGDNLITSSADNEAEQFVPGRMNVNTTPTWLLAMMSPLPESLADLEQYYQAIGEYRDRPASRQLITGVTGLPSDHNADKGVRSIGELMLVKRRIGTTTDNQKSTRYGEDNAFMAATSSMRPYPHLDDRSTSKAFDEEYTAQERMARFQYLSNTLTTRSDRYCAYVVIRGYTTNAFNQAPAESLRFFVTLDRSGLVDIDSAVTVFPKTGQKN